MKMKSIHLAILLIVGIPAFGDTKGFCPSLPQAEAKVASKPSAPPSPPVPDAQYAGSVVLVVVISDQGYVCDAKVIRGLDKQTNKMALKSVREQHFQPAQKDGTPVAVTVALEVHYWRENGKLLQSPLEHPRAK